MIKKVYMKAFQGIDRKIVQGLAVKLRLMGIDL